MKSTAGVTTIAIDLAKDVFQLALADASWHILRSLRNVSIGLRQLDQELSVIKIPRWSPVCWGFRWFQWAPPA